MTVMTILRRRSSALAVLLLVPTLAACGFGVQTNKQYQAGAGVDNRDSIVNILNAAVVIPKAGATDGVFVGSFANTSGSDPAAQTSYTTGQTATIESISITQPAGGTVNPHITLAPSSSYNPQPVGKQGAQGIPITVPANLAQNGSPADGAYVTMSFVINTGTAQTVTMRVPVFLADAPNSYWAQYLPTGGASATPTSGASGAPTSSATPTPASATPTP